MRYVGFTLIAIGIASIGFMVIYPHTAMDLRLFASGVMSIVAGARFVKAYPKRSLPFASERPVSRDSTEGDLEIPMTSEAASVIDGALAKLNRTVFRSCAGIVLLGQVIGIVLYKTTNPEVIWTYLIGAGIGVVAILMWGAVWFFKAKQARRDKRALTYLRTTGPIQLHSIRYNYHVLHLRGRSFSVDDDSAMRALQGLDWASIDY